MGEAIDTADAHPVVVIGGANVDVKARSTGHVVTGTSNPGVATMSPGGVGRNVAENLARLGVPTLLVAAVGRDPLGAGLLETTRSAGVDVSLVRDAERTGTYTAVMGADGELLVAVADMAATDALGVETVRAVAGFIESSPMLVVDGNLAAPTLEAAVGVAEASGVPTVLDPVSVPKAHRFAPRLTHHRWHAVTPTRAELHALTGHDSVGAAAGFLNEHGVEHVWVRLGAAGSVLCSAGAEPVHLEAVPGPVADVTGAGDAMLAAYCFGVLSGRSPVDAARLGHVAAALTVQSTHTVRPDLTLELVLAHEESR